MKILITAGNTQTPLDQVRVITNVFSGRTGSQLARAAVSRGHGVCLLTSHPELVADMTAASQVTDSQCNVLAYQTFDDLQALMGQQIRQGDYHAVIHCAAVSDYRLSGTYVPARGIRFDTTDGTWHQDSMETGLGLEGPTLVDASAGKIKSNHQELWLRMTPTPKLVDSIRSPWGFQGILVKFKLEVGLTESTLLEIAEASRKQSQADLMVANTLEGMREWAYIGPVDGSYHRIARSQLATELLEQIERLDTTLRKPTE